MTATTQPDRSVIGGVPTPPLAFLPDPDRLFATRARRLSRPADTLYQILMASRLSRV